MRADRVKSLATNIELIEAVRAANPIEQVLSERVQLRRSGAQLVGRCPLHADKTPSFYVHPRKGVFRCHGCGAGGDVFRYIQLLNGCSFPQALRHLAVRADIYIDGFRPTPELTAKVTALKLQREEESAFKRFCDERIEAVSQKLRSLARAATQDCLRAGESDPQVHEMAWAALGRWLDFGQRIEREGLCDLEVLRSEWRKMREAA